MFPSKGSLFMGGVIIIRGMRDFSAVINVTSLNLYERVTDVICIYGIQGNFV